MRATQQTQQAQQGRQQLPPLRRRVQHALPAAPLQLRPPPQDPLLRLQPFAHNAAGHCRRPRSEITELKRQGREAVEAILAGGNKRRAGCIFGGEMNGRMNVTGYIYRCRSRTFHQRTAGSCQRRR